MELVGEPLDLSATTDPTPKAEENRLAFGEYVIYPQRRQLLADSKIVELGSRAFDTLMALVEADGRLVTKDQLLRQVWPGTIVAEKNISVQISAVRKALGKGRSLVQTDAGRGYRFTGVICRIGCEPELSAIQRTSVAIARQSAASVTDLPVPISSLIGREHELDVLPRFVATHRLVTLTGAGGIGKTRLGLEAARLTLMHFGDGVCVTELGSVTDAELVPSTIARSLGIELSSLRNPVEQIMATLHRKHLLLVLDNCEQVIDVVAHTAERLLVGADRLHVLATSQELLAVDGEQVYDVAPLDVPNRELRNASEAMEYSAIQLFVQRAQAMRPSFTLDDSNASPISNICRRVDGIPLAIELAAARVTTIGLNEVAARLADRLRLLRGGRRTALRRHQTLRGGLDWSYGLLAEADRALLRRLAIFAGSFSLGAAVSVASADETIDRWLVTDQLADLIRKSLVTLVIRDPIPRYRLLETTRAYALEKLAETDEWASLSRRHAGYYRNLLEAEVRWESAPAAELAATYAPEIDNIHLALTWAFAPDGDAEIGAALVAASIPLWTSLSILGECRHFVHLALSHLRTNDARSYPYEMLKTSVARSSFSANLSAGSETCSAAEQALERFPADTSCGKRG
jgi:predicted ATPase/DNA-binding winged helix-turn-helix (wHTH) protein